MTQIKEEDKTLQEVSKKFSDLSQEAKRVLDSIKEKSDKRKEEHGITDGVGKPQDHHKEFPPYIEDHIDDTDSDIKMLDKAFVKFVQESNDAVRKLQASKDRVVEARKDSSLYGNQNVFQKLKETKEDRAKEVFGPRGRGIY